MNPFEVNPFELDTDKQFELVNETTENDLLVSKVIELEESLKLYKSKIKEFEEGKEKIRQELIKRNITSWKLRNGTKLTVIEDSEPKKKTKIVFAEITFKNDYPELYQQYCKEMDEVTNGRKGYLKITLPKE